MTTKNSLSQASFMLLACISMMSFASGGCGSPTKQDKKGSAKQATAQSTATAIETSSGATPRGANTPGTADGEGDKGGAPPQQGTPDTPNNGSGGDPQPSTGSSNSPVQNPNQSPPSPPGKGNTPGTDPMPPAPQPPFPPSPPKSGNTPKEITFSISLMKKLCGLDHDGIRGDLEDVAENLMTKKDAPADELANKPEFGMLTAAEITTVRPLVEMVRPKRYDRMEEVLCDDFDGSGRIFEFDTLVDRINR